ncbi:RNA polymerase sigma factor [Salmonirosea aquatica]|uniref:Uncharacterized protein n=1 Tax=Salmonirosea aquatica TaxID=2654236 RepID=A0A7C9FSG2_9BACT|nr:hypothetical protein [Cytophagaceae bacterium SJW1-29]
MDLSELQDAATAELIEYIQGRDIYFEAAECAFKNFFFRFEGELTKKCRVVVRHWGYDEMEGDVLSEQTLEKFWLKPQGFDAGKCKVKDFDTCVLLYLLAIARNLLNDRHREALRHPDPYSGSEDIVVDFPDLEESELPPEKLRSIRAKYDLIIKALDRLSYKHRVIYLTYKSHEKLGMNLPRHVLRRLREELDLAQGTIRVYKKEAYETVEQILDIYGKK